MKKLLLIILLLMANLVMAADEHPLLPSLKHSRQLLVVTTPGWDTSYGHMQLYDRNTFKQSWQAVGAPIPVVVGKDGLAWSATLPAGVVSGMVKKEGDLRTPAGVFPLSSAFGFGPKYIKNIKLPYIQIEPTTVCVDDSNSEYYNRIINSSRIKKPDWKSGEQMRQIPQYMWGVEVGYNAYKPLAEGGSCVFLHIWRGPDKGTAGCIAMSEPKVEEIITWLNPRKRPQIVILPQTAYKALEKSWGLPA